MNTDDNRHPPGVWTWRCGDKDGDSEKVQYFCRRGRRIPIKEMMPGKLPRLRYLNIENMPVFKGGKLDSPAERISRCL